MSLVTLNVDLNEVRAIREALEALVRLLEAKLLADGYLQPPPERVPSTLADVRVVDSRSVWQKIEQQQKAEKRRAELSTDLA